MKKYTPIILALVMVGCTSVQVQPIQLTATQPPIKEICVEHNPAVTIDVFVPTLEKRFQHHGIRTRIVQPSPQHNCQYYLQYSARRSWDITTYLSWAELKLYQNDILVADALYKLKAKGGLALTKWQSVEIKMNPVIDSLLGKDKNSQTTPMSYPSTTQEVPLLPKKVINEDQLNLRLN